MQLLGVSRSNAYSSSSFFFNLDVSWVAETEVHGLPVARENRKQTDGWEVRTIRLFHKIVCKTRVMRFSLIGARDDNWLCAQQRQS